MPIKCQQCTKDPSLIKIVPVTLRGTSPPLKSIAYICSECHAVFYVGPCPDEIIKEITKEISSQIKGVTGQLKALEKQFKNK